MSHIHLTLAEGYYRPGPHPDLDEIIRRWQEDGDKIYDDAQPVSLPVSVLWPHREYTWSPRAMRMSRDEWDAVVASLKRRGWRPDEPLWFEIGRDGGAKVGEGNHRLAIARDIGLRTVPVRFIFRAGTVRKAPQRAARAEAPARHPHPRPTPPRPAPERPAGPVDPETERQVQDILDLLGG